MKRMLLLASLAIAVIMLSLAAKTIAQRSSSSSDPTPATQWEYLVVAGGTANLSSVGMESRMHKQPDDSFNREAYALERNLDKLGAKGWQLVAVSGPPNDPVFYLKRPKESR